MFISLKSQEIICGKKFNSFQINKCIWLQNKRNLFYFLICSEKQLLVYSQEPQNYWCFCIRVALIKLSVVYCLQPSVRFTLNKMKSYDKIIQ